MKLSRLLTPLLFSLFIVGYLACKKTDSFQNKPEIPPDRFFSVSSNAPKEIKLIADAIKKQNDKYNYLSSITKRSGYPRWDKARIANFDKGSLTGRGADEVSGEVVYVPFVRDSDNYVNSLLMVKIDATDTIFRMVHDYSYKVFGYDTTDHSKWNARDVFNLFTSFDYSVFGHTKFWVKDTNLFKPENDSSYVIATRVNGSSHRKSARVSLYAVEECVTWEICTYPGAGPTGPDGSDPTPPGGGTSGGFVRAMGNCSYLDICTTYYYDDGGGGSTGTGDGTGGGGGTGWYGGSNPCTGSTPTAVPRLSNVAPDDGCGSGWTPVTNNLPQPTSDPCLERAEIASQEANQTISNINSAIRSYILNNINSTTESGAEHNLKSLSNTNDFMNVPTRSNSQSHTFVPNFTWNPTNGFTIGVSHGHNPPAAPSPADVVWMYGNLSDPDLNSSGPNGIDYYKGHISVTALTLNNTYVIRPSSWLELQKAYNSYSKSFYQDANGVWQNTKDQLYGLYSAQYKATHGGATDEDASIYALLYMYGTTINLFKASTGSNAYEVMTLDANGNVTVKTCN